MSTKVPVVIESLRASCSGNGILVMVKVAASYTNTRVEHFGVSIIYLYLFSHTDSFTLFLRWH